MMLVLARRIEQSIYLDIAASDYDRKVLIKVIDIKGAIVRIGIEADSTVVVDINDDKTS